MPDTEVLSIEQHVDAAIRGRRGSASSPVITADGSALSLSEDNIARVFSRIFAGSLLFDHTCGRWRIWDGIRWATDEHRLAFNHAREVVKTLNTDDQAKWARASVFSAVETIARADPIFARTLDEFDADPFLLGTPAGIVNLKTGELRSPAPSAMITRVTGAAPEDGNPSLWLKFLNEATGGNNELIVFLQRLSGYFLTGSTIEHLLAFLLGPGGNGKSVLINVLMRVMGDYAQAVDMRVFTAGNYDRHPTELAALRGARLVCATETEAGSEFAEARIKQLTGGDVVRARFMRQDEFEFRPQFKLLIVGNHRPRLRDVGESMRRRFRLVTFDHKPRQVDSHLESKLLRESGQILAWMIRGCLLWQQHGLTTPSCVAAATDDFFESQDLFGEWLRTRVTHVPASFVSSTAAYKSWSAFAEQSGDRPDSQVRFADEMKRRGYRKKRVTNGVVWEGVRLRAGNVG